MNRKIQLAWAAGFFDGEGCTYLCSGGARKRKTLRLCVWQKDPRPLRRFNRVVGYGTVYGPYASQGDMYEWVVQCDRAERVLALLWPYLSQPKKEQAMAKLAEWDEQPGKRKTWAASGRAA